MSNKGKQSPTTKKVSSVLKYTGVAFQLAAMIFIGIWVGQWLDHKLQLEKPYMTIVLIILFFSGFMYKLYMDLIKDND